MLQLQVIGNLGADAEVKDFNGNKAVSFNVAHTERWTDAEGTKHESTTWVSCLLNGDGGKLLPFLKKGTSVFVEGAGSARCYSSPKERKFVAGLNLNVRHVELVGGKVEDVPRELCSVNGDIFPTGKAYFVGPEGVDASGAKKGQKGLLIDKNGVQYDVDEYGYVKRSENTSF